MRIADFDKAMPKGIVIDKFRCKNGEVVSCLAHRDTTLIVFDHKGRAFSHDKECRKTTPFLTLIRGEFCLAEGYALDIRLPEFDLKFDMA